MGRDSVRRVAEAVERLADDGMEIVFEISTHPYWYKTAAPEFQHFKRTMLTTARLDPAEYRRWLADADGLVIAYNFDLPSKTYVKYSMANKLPECLASGAAVLAHGPEDIATISYLKSLNCAMVLSDQTPGALSGAIKRLVQNPEYRRELAKKAKSIAFADHNVHNIRRKFEGAISRLTTRDQSMKATLEMVDIKCHGILRAIERHSALLEALPGITDANRRHFDTSFKSDATLGSTPQSQGFDYKTLPWDATVLVVSGGEESRLNLGGRRAWHFPRNADGSHDQSSSLKRGALVAHMEVLRTAGADHILIPSVSSTFLVENPELKCHLEDNYDRIVSNDACLLYRISASSLGKIQKSQSLKPGSAGITPSQLTKESFSNEGSQRREVFDLKLDERKQQWNYSNTLAQIAEIAIQILPAEANVLVISKGDENLVRLVGRKATHFPQVGNGVYAGYHPSDSAAAIAEVEALRLKGASHLLVPNTAFWWFQHYPEFKQHLDRQYCIIPTPECCTVFNLSPPTHHRRSGPKARKQPSGSKAVRSKLP